MRPSPTIHRFGPFEFVPEQQELRLGEERKPLPKAMNRLLQLLVSRPGEIVTREEIADLLWSDQGTVDVTAGINTAINRLRSTIGDNNGHGVFIETVVGAGYRFTASVETFTEPVAEEVEAARELVKLVPAIKAGGWYRWAIASVVVLLVAALGWWKLRATASAGFVASPTELYTPMMQPVTADDPVDELTQQALSPSGRLLSFSDRNGIFVRTLGAGAVQRLEAPAGLEVTRISWFPDEAALLVSGTIASSATPSLWKIPVRGSAFRVLLENAEAGTVSPEGGRIAFLRGGQTELWVANADGGASRRLVHVTNADLLSGILWAPAGDRLIADRKGNVLSSMPAADVTTAKSSNKAALPEHEAVYESYRATDGKLLAQRPGVPFDTAVLLRDGTFYYPVASGGGAQRVAVAQTDSATGAFRSKPVILTSRQVFSDDFTGVEQIAASADGRTLAALMNRGSDHIFVADLVGASSGRPHLEHEVRWSRHTFTTLPTAWSRDGRMIVADEGFMGPISITGQTMDGGETKVFAAAGPQGNYTQAHYSADRKWLLYLHLLGSNVQAMERVPANGGEAHIVPNTKGIAEFRCSSSAAGHCVVRVIEGNQAIAFHELDPVAGVGRVLARLPWKPTALGDWSVSPDGGTLALAEHDPAHPGVQLVSLRGAAARTLAIPGYGTVLGVSWTVDGKAFLVHTSSPAGYNVLYVAADGKATSLRRSPDLIWAVQSPDGKRVAFPLTTASNRNVWVGATHLGVQK